ncbi:hypothetical protein GEMRC1_009481 [Eukaryota sp. GEM-RC1]
MYSILLSLIILNLTLSKLLFNRHVFYKPARISHFYLSNNSIVPEGAIAIAEALKVNSSVSHIHVSYNSIGNEGAIAIAEALKVNSSVSTIYLYNNSIGNEGAIAIAEALKVNSSVSKIILDINSINSQTQQSLKSLHKNRIRF